MEASMLAATKMSERKWSYAITPKVFPLNGQEKCDNDEIVIVIESCIHIFSPMIPLRDGLPLVFGQMSPATNWMDSL